MGGYDSAPKGRDAKARQGSAGETRDCTSPEGTARNLMSDENKNKHIEPVCPGKKDKLDLVQVRSDIEKKNGPEFWRSLEELAGSADFREMMHREFPKGASELVD